MPICARCKVAYLDGETHGCPPKSRRAVIIWGCMLVIYAVSAWVAGSPIAPAVVVLYLAVALAAGVGHVVANVLHAFAG